MTRLQNKIFRNTIANIVQKGVRVLDQLLLVPFFIMSWGAAYYGEWLTLTIIPSVLVFADLGFGSAAANGFVLKYAAGEWQGAANIRSSGVRIILLMVGFGTLLSILSMLVIKQQGLLDKSLIEAEDALYAVSLLITARLTGFFNQLFEAYYRAVRKAALSINLLTVQSFMNICLGAIILLMGYGVVEFAGVQLLVSVVFTFFFGWKGNRLLKESGNLPSGQFTRVDVKMITGKGLGYLMSPVWQALYFQGTTLVVRLTLGAEAVAIFNTVRTFTRSVNQLFSVVNGSVFPELQYEIGAGNLLKAHRLYRVSIFTVFIIGLVGAGALWLFGAWFYRIWTNNQLVVPQAVWVVFIIGVVFNALWWTAGMVFRAVNRPYQFAIVGVSAAGLSVLLCYVLSKEYGLLGASLGYLALDVLMAFYVLPMGSRLIGLKTRYFKFSLIKP